MKTPNPSPSAESTAGGQGGGSVGEGPRDKGDTGGELFKVDLDPTGMYAAACSFDKVCARCSIVVSVAAL